MEQDKIRVKSVYLQLVNKELQNVEKFIKLKPNASLYQQWDDVVSQLELKKHTKEYSLNFLFPVKPTSQKYLDYLEFIPVEGDVVLFMNPVGAKNINKPREKRCLIF